jgi:hypothetical protein
VAIKYSEESVQDEEFIIVYSSLYDEFWINRGFLPLLYYPIFFLRRLVYSIVQIFFSDFMKYQAYMNVAFTLFVLVYLIYYQPFKAKLILVSQIIGEICIFIVFFVSSFFMYTERNYYVGIIDKICVYTIVCAIGVQFIINIILMIKTLKEFWDELIKQKALRFREDALKFTSLYQFNSYLK